MLLCLHVLQHYVCRRFISTFIFHSTNIDSYAIDYTAIGGQFSIIIKKSELIRALSWHLWGHFKYS